MFALYVLLGFGAKEQEQCRKHGLCGVTSDTCRVLKMDGHFTLNSKVSSFKANSTASNDYKKSFRTIPYDLRNLPIDKGKTDGVTSLNW